MTVVIENIQDIIEITEDVGNILNKAAELSLQVEGFKINSEISILLTDNDTIRSINNEHRSMDMPTDVLSFPMIEMEKGKISTCVGDYDMDKGLLLLGDIVISMEMAKKQADEYGHAFERELAFLMTHGVFHLLGYDHENEEDEKEMLGKQEAVLIQMRLQREDK